MQTDTGTGSDDTWSGVITTHNGRQADDDDDMGVIVNAWLHVDEQEWVSHQMLAPFRGMFPFFRLFCTD
jgi:hypothetical protein